MRYSWPERRSLFRTSDRVEALDRGSPKGARVVRKIILALALVMTAVPAFSQELPGEGPVPLLYLHPLVNYGFDPEWTRAWERGLQTRNSLRVNVGSVSTDDFLTDVILNVTEPIGGRFRLLYDMRWFEALHVETRDAEHFLGFEFSAADWLALQGQAHPASDKEELDLRFGLLLHSKDREQYARVLVRWDDPLFGEKNELGGAQAETATSLEWTARGVLERFEVFTQGRYGTGWERSYSDPAVVPLLEADARQQTGSVSRARWLASGQRFMELEFAHHQYESSKTPRATGAPEPYRNRLIDLVLRGVWRFDDRWRARGELHRVDQKASSPEFEYARQDWMPAVWLAWAIHGAHAIEAGYMGTSYEWTGSPSGIEAEDGFRQKLELAWVVRPSDHARLQFSLSHEPDPQRFGGANIQVQLGF